MTSVWINGRQHEGIDEGWINRTIRGMRADGQTVCVRVSVDTSALKLTLTAGVCQGGAGGGRAPSAAEAEVINAWNASGLVGDADFPVGRLIQCLKRVERSAR